MPSRLRRDSSDGCCKLMEHHAREPLIPSACADWTAVLKEDKLWSRGESHWTGRSGCNG